MSSSELSQIPGHPKIDIQSRDRKVCLPTQFNPKGVTWSPSNPMRSNHSNGAAKSSSPQIGYDYDSYLSVLPRQVYFQPLSLLQISAAVSTWQQRAGLATHSFSSLGQALPGSQEDWSCQLANHVLSAQSSTPVTAALQGCEKNSIRSSSSITLCLGLQQMSGRDRREQ